MISFLQARGMRCAVPAGVPRLKMTSFLQALAAPPTGRYLTQAAALAALILLTVPVRAQAPLGLIDSETRVGKVSFKFVDTKSFTERRLEEQIATAAPGFFDRVRRIIPFVSTPTYRFHPIELQRDVVRLRNFYRRNGFLHPSIDYPASQLDTSRNAIHVVFTIEEGPPLIIQDVGFFSPDGGFALTQFEEPTRSRWIEFRDQTTLRVGERFTQFQGSRIQDQVLTWLKNAGYAFATVRSEVDIDSLANTADIRFITDPGPVTYVSEIQIEGAENVANNVIMREIPLKVGDRFSHRRMVQGQRELFGLNLFRVALAEVPEQPRDSTVVIRYRLREAKPRTITAETGYARDDGASVEADWTHRNFLGGARQLTFTALVRSGFGALTLSNRQTVRRLNLVVSLRQPYLFTNKLSGTLAPFFLLEENPRLNIASREGGFNSTLLYEIHPFRTASLQYTFSRAQPLGDGDGIPLDFGLLPRSRRPAMFDRSILSLSGMLGKADSYLYPRRGFLIRPLAETAGRFLASDVEYHKLRNEATAYLPIGGGRNVNARLVLGYIRPFGRSRNQRDREVEFRFDPIRFYAGGGNDVRGWRNDLLGPKFVLADTVRADGEVVLDDQGEPTLRNFRYEPEGGLGKVAFNVEMRLPFRPFGTAWRSALFIDGGQVYRDPSYDLTKLRYGVGGGIRYQTLVGFLRLDLAFKVNPDLTDIHSPEEIYRLRRGLISESELSGGFMRRFRLHLSIGQAF